MNKIYNKYIRIGQFYCLFLFYNLIIENRIIYKIFQSSNDLLSLTLKVTDRLNIKMIDMAILMWYYITNNLVASRE